jgi:hypothetical protein
VKDTKQKEIAHVIGQFDSCRLSKDGGGKITFEFGSESLEAIQLIQTWHNQRPANFAIAVKPINE